ncbi:MAG: hypothetical protein K6G67_00720 [Lachnospiraceae bacterium]|nr:hypothetical protein [Lachnospiraceae bacterium]
MYRKQDLQYLQDIFDRSSNDIAVLYGKTSSGLSEILSDFIKDKECLYYWASAVNDSLQRQLFAGELHEQTRSPIFPTDDYDKLINTYLNEKTDRKKLIVFDDFDFLVKDNKTFVNFLAGLLFGHSNPGICMILLVSANIRWVENDMVKTLGRKSSEISGVIKLNEYTPTEFYECFPGMPLAEAMGIYALIGGKCHYFDKITADTTMKSFINMRLERWADIDNDPYLYLPKEIREPSLYNTILVNIAAGNGKLNDLHTATGMDRGKLSVYIKTLIEHGIVSKVVSADIGKGTETQKGMYRIEDRMIRFYYRHVFPHLSSLRILGPERFYRKFIEHGIVPFMEEVYPLYCMEHVKWLRDNNRLTFKVASVEEYHDKNGYIDFVVIAAGGSVIACSCRYAPPHMSYAVIDKIKATVRKDKILCDNIWLFSASGFDQKLSMYGSVTPGINLIDGEAQRLH